ncbi:MAG: hypothetical protein IE910_05755 [Brevundimonas sp.]|nr:hypothetical protein [Brevundimonas sp.]
MILAFIPQLLNRIAKRAPDPKATTLAKAYALDEGAAWLLARLTEAEGELDRQDVAWWLVRNIWMMKRVGLDLEQVADQIRTAIGSDAMETTATGWRLSPLGRLRTRRALGEDLVF